MTFHTLMPGAFGKAGNPLTVRKLAGAWFIRQPATIDGVVVDERRGLGTDRPPLPLRALDLNGTNQYGHIPVDQVEYPFSLFGWADTASSASLWLFNVSDPSNSTRYLAVGFDDGDTVLIGRRNTTETSNSQAVPLVTGWFSCVAVFQDSTNVLIYRNGALLHTFSSVTSVAAGAGVTRFAFGTYRTASPGAYWDGLVQHVGFLRRAATLADAQEFHETGIIPDAEVLLPLDNNSTTVSYNIGKSASWWLSEPRRNLESYPQDLTNAVWRKSAVSPTATKIVETATTAEHRIDNLTQFAVVTGETWSLSFSAKAAERTRIRAGFDSLGILNARGFFDLSNGTADNTIAGSTYTITPDTDLGSGWYRCTVTSTAIGSGNVRIEINLVSGTGSLATTVSYLGDIVNGVFVTNIQRERGVATTFQSVPGSGIEYPEATLVNAPPSYVGRDVLFSRQNKIGYSTRRNLATLTEQFNSWGVTGTTVTTNVIANPLDGSVTADALFEVAAASIPRIAYPVSSPTGGPYKWVIYAKANGRDQIRIVVDGDGAKATYFTLAGAGSVTPGINATATIEALADGWYKCVNIVTPISGSAYIATASGGTAIPSGDNTKGVYLFGAGIYLDDTAYQRIGANPGTTVLFPALLDDTTKSAARDTLQYQGEAHMDGQLEDANCFTFDLVDDYISANLNDFAGSEMILNGGLDTDLTSWTQVSSTNTWIAGKIQVVTASGAGQARQIVTTVVGRTYLLCADLTYGNITGILRATDSTGVQIGASQSASSTSLKLLFVATDTSTRIELRNANTGTNQWDNVSVKELPTLGSSPRIGPTLVSNGGFDSDTYWTKSNTTISGGVAVFNTASNAYVGVSGLLRIGVRYRATATILNHVSGILYFRDGTTNFAMGSANGTFTIDFTATGTTCNFQTLGTVNLQIDNVSVCALGMIDSQGTAMLYYRPQCDGILAHAGTAFNIRFGDIEHIPCCEGAGSILHGTLLEQEYSIGNGQASNWATLQNEYFYSTKYGFNRVSGVNIPASQLNPTLDVFGDPLSNPPRIGLNGSEVTINFSPVDNSWSDVYSIPGADLSNYEIDGDPGDAQPGVDKENYEGKFKVEKQ